MFRKACLADIIAAQVDQHDVLAALLLVSQQLLLQGHILCRGFAPPPSASQRPAQALRVGLRVEGSGC